MSVEIDWLIDDKERNDVGLVFIHHAIWTIWGVNVFLPVALIVLNVVIYRLHLELLESFFVVFVTRRQSFSWQLLVLSHLTDEFLGWFWLHQPRGLRWYHCFLVYVEKRIPPLLFGVFVDFHVFFKVCIDWAILDQLLKRLSINEYSCQLSQFINVEYNLL